MKIIRKIVSVFLILAMLVVLLFNLRLYYQPRFIEIGDSRINKDLFYQLNYLKEEMHRGAASDMQRLFPEGFVFLKSLYALSWIELAEIIPSNEELFEEAIEEINWSIKGLESAEAKRPFNESLDLPFGIFYNGWYNYVLARKINLKDDISIDSFELQKLRKNCTNILTALEISENPFLESYSGGCWPADMTVAMASVAWGNKTFNGEFNKEINSWLRDVELKTDNLGLIPHSSQSGTGEVLEEARGSSQSLILNFLIEIDSAYARSKFEFYKKYFLDYRLGMPGIREYPHGKKGKGDIDSGPVIFDIGGAASIVGKRVMSRYDEDDVAVGLRNSIETFGAAMTINKKKKYLFGKLPMADGFIAWSNSSEASKEELNIGNSNWRIKIQLISFSFLLILIISLFRLNKKKA